MRRCQILRASARGERAPAIAHLLGCDKQTVRNVIHEFNANGLTVLRESSSRPHRLRTTFSDKGLERLRDVLHRSPHDFGKEPGIWTLELAAPVSFEQGITPTLVSDESVRRALKRLKTNWKRAKHWITSHDPLHLKKTARDQLTSAMKSGGAALLSLVSLPGKARSIRCVWRNSPGKRAIRIPKLWPVLASCGKRVSQTNRSAINCGFVGAKKGEGLWGSVRGGIEAAL